ncbi:hypothetical protein O1611_g9857 [Lasiodiplodia mahajangana]|uniref:Uncharacterized protein n=1 Tax=Lasiodiplodia mahajangana TaxID=1108764 RepID=A0ACC2J4S3_9PEZI|nr:hypothetical protein O1611_g9857 [Lasiodiplodia mahajangana]
MAAPSSQNDMSLQPKLYSPLDHSRRMIRLIEILPSDADDEQVSCRLEAVELSQDTRYAALSYVWGDTNTTETIIVNGVELPVTINLASALRHFRHSGFPQTQETGKLQCLWADAICINQAEDRDGLAERNHQVALMGDIYRNASSVLSWLGPPDSNRIDLALQVIHDIAPVIGTTFEKHDLIDATLQFIPELRPIIGTEFVNSSKQITDGVRTSVQWLASNLGAMCLEDGSISPKWMPLHALSKNIYWARVWIVQEMVLAKSPSAHWFICGTTSITFVELRRFNDFLLYFGEQDFPWSPTDNEVGSTNTPLLASLSQPNCGIFRIWTLSHVVSLQQRAYSFWKEERSASVFLEAFANAMGRSATRPHDYLYAVLGLFSTSIKPDYNKSVKEVYLEAFLSCPGDLFHLSLELSGRGFNDTNEHNIPSWLPDLSKIGSRGVDYLFEDTNESRKPLLDINTISQARIIADDILRVQGVVCAQVQLVKKLTSLYTDGESYLEPLYRLGLDYLIDFFGIDDASRIVCEQEPDRSPGHMAGKVFGKRPLEALIDVLDWSLGYSRRKRSSFGVLSGPELSVVGWDAFLVFGGGPRGIDEDELHTAATKLGITDRSLPLFISASYVDMTSISENQEQSAGTRPDQYELMSLAFEDLGQVLKAAKGRTLFKTTLGHLGIGPSGMREGDLVCAVDRVKLPVLLRKIVTRDGTGSQYEHVGCCYVLGLSDGEPAEMVAKGELGIQTFDLR